MPSVSPSLKLTKPVPPPPHGGRVDLADRSVLVKDMGHYDMPMASLTLPAWKQVLQEVKYPTDVLVLDFETFFDDRYTMHGTHAVSTVEYLMDPQFELTGVAWFRAYDSFVDYQNTTQFRAGPTASAEAIRHLQDVYGENLERCTVVAQNASFDLAILAWRFGIYPPYFIDTLGLARHWNARARNGLDHLTKRWKLPQKGDTQKFKGLSFRARYKRATRGPKIPKRVPPITQEQVAQLAEYTINDVQREWELFTLLLPRLSNPRTELRLMKHTIELFTQPTLHVDADRARELVDAMDAEIAAVCDAVGATRKDIGSNTRFSELLGHALAQAGDSITNYQKVGKSGMLLAIAKEDESREELLYHRDARVRALMEARIGVKSWPLHIARVQRIVRQARPLGKLPVPLKYHGAHTGRYSGGEKINLQNLGSRSHKLVNAIREILIAPPGDELVICDASQIEARVLAWLAGQDDLVEKFAKGEEIYCGFATRVLGFPVRKPKKEGGIPAVEARMAWARNSIGKVGVLGCGYGMGAKRAVSYGKGSFDLETAKRIVAVYHKDNDKIVAYWDALKESFAYTLKFKRPCECGYIRFDHRDDCDVVITLPNGRELKYHDARLKRDGWRETIEVLNPLKHTWDRVWGGHLAENVTQAVARDILVESMLRLEDLGHHTVMSVHDELVIHAQAGKGAAILKQAEIELSRVPAWAPGCPLGAEGVVTTRYGGH